jgi:pimeloyl-ACP methyl ester carboxylesterase
VAIALRDLLAGRGPALSSTTLVLLATLLAGCGGRGAPTASTGERPAPRQPAPRLVDPRPCRAAATFTCSTLAVPLDHSGGTAGTLRLRIAVAGEASAPLGTLVFLTGGPGQPGVPFATRTRRLLAPLAGRLRIVLLDQRGTGTGALRCPLLQASVGTSDLTVPPPGAVEACARRLGERRRFFATADTVADLETLRRALGASRLALDGVSYGTFVAQRYAIAHPTRVSRLVLDSVVPAAGLDGLEVDGMRASARVLRAACRAQACATDPATDLAAVIRRAPERGPALFDTLVARSVGAPAFPGVAGALHAARAGRLGPLERLEAAVRRAQRAPVALFSAGLHAATLCADLRAPWGAAAAPLAGRRAAVARAAARTDPRPFDRRAVRANGLVATCARWPPTPAPPPLAGATLPPVPVLLLAGGRDLSTPLAWARRQLARTPRGRLVVVPGAGHSVQSRAASPRGRRAVLAFLHDPPDG